MKLCKKIQFKDYSLYGFSNDITTNFVKKWDGINLKTLEIINEKINFELNTTDRIEFLAYIIFLWLIINKNKNKKLCIFESDLIKQNSWQRMNTIFELNSETKKNHNPSSGTFSYSDTSFLVNIESIDSFLDNGIFNYVGDTAIEFNVFIVAEKYTKLDLIKYLSHNKELKKILNICDFMITLTFSDSFAYMHGLSIYTKNNIDDELENIESIFFQYIDEFNTAIVNCDKSDIQSFLESLNDFISILKK